ERGYPGRLRRRDHTSHTKIISPATSTYGTTLNFRFLHQREINGLDFLKLRPLFPMVIEGWEIRRIRVVQGYERSIFEDFVNHDG
ncbi:hypothetical protein, partial [Streptodolium elevatio]